MPSLLPLQQPNSPPNRGSIHFYGISCCVWIFDSKPNTERNQRLEARVAAPTIRRSFEFSSFLGDKDPWSFPSWTFRVDSHRSHQCSALITVSADISLALKSQKVGRKSVAGIPSRHFRQLIGRAASLVWVSANKARVFEWATRGYLNAKEPGSPQRFHLIKPDCGLNVWFIIS